MANDIQKDPMFLDSTGNIETGRVMNLFKSVEWVKPAGVGDRAYLYDKNGQVVCDFTCDIPERNQRLFFGDKGQVFDGPFVLAQLDSGYLLVSRV